MTRRMLTALKGGMQDKRTPEEWASRVSVGADGMKLSSPDGLRVMGLPNDYTRILRMDGVSYNYGQIYASQPNVRTVIDRIARDCAEIAPPKLFQKVPGSKLLPSGRLELDENPLYDLLRDPVPGESVYDWYFALFADMLVYDEMKFIIVRQGDQPYPSALVRVPPPNLIPQRDPVTQMVTGWRAANTNQEIPLNRVLWIRGYDPVTNQGAVPPMESLRSLLKEEAAREKAREAMRLRALRKDGVIERHLDAPKMSDEARESFMVDAEEALAGSTNGYRPFMLEPGMTWKDVRWSPEDMAYLAARRLSRQEACAMFHVPASLVSANEKGGEADERTLRIYHQSTLPPYLARVEAALEAKLLPMFTPGAAARRRQYIKFNLDEKLRGSFEERAKIMATTVGGPVATVNEGRSRLDLPPTDDPDDDLIYKPTNSLRGGGPQASPQNPVETPATTAGHMEPAGTTATPSRGASRPEPKGDVIDIDLRAEVDAFEQRLAAERERAAKAARVEERITAALQHHLARQKAAGLKRYDEDRWNRELADDFAKHLAPVLGAELFEDERLDALKSAAAAINLKTEENRDDPTTFDVERARATANAVSTTLLSALERLDAGAH